MLSWLTSEIDWQLVEPVYIGDLDVVAQLHDDSFAESGSKWDQKNKMAASVLINDEHKRE